MENLKDIMRNRQDLINNTASQLIGLEILEARQKLGYWWILESQSVNVGCGSRYTFNRAGVGKITLYTNAKSIVIQTPTETAWGDKRKKKLKC